MTDDYYETNIDWKEPWEYIEGEEEQEAGNEYREASLRFLQIMEITVSYILNSSDTLAASYGAAYALGLGESVGGKSMLQVSKEIGVSTGTISNHAKNVRLITGLPPSALMLKLEQADNHRQATIANLQ